VQNRLTVKVVGVLAFFGVLFTFFGVGVAKYFGWPTDWALLSLLHIASLCLLYILIQDFAATKSGKWAFIFCCFSVAILFAFGSYLPVAWYFVSAIFFELVLVVSGFYLLSKFRNQL